tara:strand:- start:247 stop:366 length:120 start_codon:yes stop_codon:yes gene_type:complete
MQPNSEKETRRKRVERALKNNLKKRKNFQKKISKKIKNI